MAGAIHREYDHLVVGGGVYGCYAALLLKQRDPQSRIAIIERERDLFQHASYNNQARVHNGYHYPRSILTGIRSRVNAPRFLAEFAPAIVTEFGQYYAIARRLSKVTPGQFELFCRHIGAKLAPAPERVAALFDEDLIEAVYSVCEPVFDAVRLRELMRNRIAASGVDIMLGTEAVRLETDGQGPITVQIRGADSGKPRFVICGHLYNCAYSRLNDLLGRSGLSRIRLRHEATEMALIEPPAALRGAGVTVMCGPFFSLMPFPARGLSTLSHVSYTPHYGWTEDPGLCGADAHEPRFPLQTRFERMRRDAARYLPALAGSRHRGSLWAVKTILPQSDANDSRPILFKRDPAAPNVVSILGGKIDNIFDLDAILAKTPEQRLETSEA